MANKVSLAGKYISLAGSQHQGGVVLDNDEVAIVVDISESLIGLLSCNVMPALQVIYAKNTTGLLNLFAANCPQLTYIDASGASLGVDYVDGVLSDLENAGNTDGTVDLSGGTNAPPSAAGLASKAILESRGWTVTVNS